MKDLMQPSVYGIGYLGGTFYPVKVNGKKTKAYAAWHVMIQRCYDPKLHARNPTYIDCSVCVEWHNYQNFCIWFNANYKDGYTLDKDILIKGNKIYSPVTCVYVPQHLNKLLTNSAASRGSCRQGVSFDKRDGKYSAIMSKYGKRTVLGYFSSEDEAYEMYKTTKIAYATEVVLLAYSNGEITTATGAAIMQRISEQLI